MHTDGAYAYRLEGGRLVCGLPEEFAGLAQGKHVVSLVGGGGKTTLLFHLAGSLCKTGRRAAVMTSTRMGVPGDWCGDMAACRARFAAGAYAACGALTGEGKFAPPDGAFLKEIIAEADVVLIEADGAHRKPFKAPDTHEPVILPQSDTVIAVAGLDALGGEVGEICHRPQRVMALLGCGPAHRLTCEDMARVLLSPEGGRKDVGEKRFVIVLNKCDDEARLAAGREVLECLWRRGQTQAMLTGGMTRSAQFERHA